MSELGFAHLLSQYDQRFRNGEFEFRSGDKLGANIRRAEVPDAPGVYVFSVDRVEQVLYVGKAGTLKTGNQWSGQKLPKRLQNRQQGLRRQEFFERKLRAGRFQKIIVRWWATFDGQQQVIPAKAEADLLQAYWDEFGQLPGAGG